MNFNEFYYVSLMLSITTNCSKKVKGKEINTLNEWFWNQEKNIRFKVRFNFVDTALS